MKRWLVAVCTCALALPARADAPHARQEKPVSSDSSHARQEKPIGSDAPPEQYKPPENIESLIFFSARPKRELDERTRAGAQLLDKMLHERETLVRERRVQAIAQLSRFVAEEPESAAEMPDALLRLAELRWEEARAGYLADYEIWQKTPANVRSASPPTADVTVALALYDRLLEKHRDFERSDLVLYMKAYALMEAGRMSDALVAYGRILGEYPSSRFRPDAQMAFAESAFNGSHDYATAYKRYQEVLKYPESELSDLALFKSAWCLWKLGDAQEAATRFREVLDLSGKLKTASAERRKRLLELQDEALEYLIAVFTEDERNSAADLHKFLSGIGGEQYAARVLHRLSRTFFDQARYARAVEAYRMLLASEADDANAPQYLRQIAAGYAALEDPEHTLAALTELARGYGAGSAWAQKQADPATVTKAEQASERAVRLQAMRYHQRAQKDQSAADFEHAAALYRVHTEAFPNASASYEVTFYLAELLFHRMNRPEEAGDYYLKAARLDPKGKFSKDALYNAVVAFEAVRVKELAGCGKPQPTAAGSTPACAETQTDKKFSEAVALYVQQYPDDPEVPGILFRQGRMYFDRGIYDPAIRQFGQLLDSYPQSEYAATAGELVLESFNRAQDFSNIEAWARKLKRAPAFQNGESQKKLDALILQSVFKSGEQLAAKGQHQQAAQAYLRATEEFPNDERAPKAYFNAGQEWQLAGDLAAAASAYDALIEHHSGTTEGALGAWSAAQMFESIAQFKDAARYYEAYAARFPQGPKREDAYYNALVLRVAAADNDKAVRDGNEFLKAYPNSTTADEAYFLVGKAHEAEKRWSDAAQTYRHYIKNGKNDERKLEAQTRLGKVLAAQGDRDGADKAFTLAAKGGRKSDRAGARYHAAEARFLQGDQALAEFEKIKIEGDVAGLRKRLAQKSELLRKAADIYGDVVDYRVSEWVAAALYKVGQSYELFADSLRKAPVPPGLSEAEEQAYRDELSKVIVPIEERALEAYESGYRKALELHVFNAWTQKQREALTRLNDVEYPPLKEAGAGLAEAVPLPLPTPLAGLQRPSDVPQPTAAGKPAGTGKGASKPTSKSGKTASGQAAPSTGATPNRPTPSVAGRP